MGWAGHAPNHLNPGAPAEITYPSAAPLGALSRRAQRRDSREHPPRQAKPCLPWVHHACRVMPQGPLAQVLTSETVSPAHTL